MVLQICLNMPAVTVKPKEAFYMYAHKNWLYIGYECPVGPYKCIFVLDQLQVDIIPRSLHLGSSQGVDSVFRR